MHETSVLILLALIRFYQSPFTCRWFQHWCSTDSYKTLYSWIRIHFLCFIRALITDCSNVCYLFLMFDPMKLMCLSLLSGFVPWQCCIVQYARLFSDNVGKFASEHLQRVSLTIRALQLFVTIALVNLVKSAMMELHNKLTFSYILKFVIPTTRCLISGNFI